MYDQVKILFVDDERNVLKSLERIFLDDDFEILTGNSGDEGLEILGANPDIQVVISDYRMPGMNGVEFLKEVYARRPDTIRIVLSGYADTSAVVAAINEGQIYRFIPKPWNDDELRITVIKAIETFTVHHQKMVLEEELRERNEELATINENLERLVNERIADILIPSHSQSNARTVLENMPVGVIEILPEGTVSKINEEAARLLGCDKESFTGRGVDESLPDAICKAFEKFCTSPDFSTTGNIQGRDIVIKGRRVSSGETDDFVLVIYPGE